MRKLIILILVVFSSSCAQTSTYEEEMETSIPAEINAQVMPNGEIIQILAPEGWNSFKLGEPVSLMFQNRSSEQIIFEHDFGVKVFFLQKGQWFKAENDIVYLDTDKIILEPNIEFDPLNIESIVVLPNIPNVNGMVEVRVFVIGTTLQDENTEGKEIATYLDLQLNP